MAIELAELIGQLRAELTAAMRKGENSELRFELGTVELELNVAVDKEAKSGGKVKFWVVEAGSDVSVKSSQTQRVKLSLNPRVSTGHNPLIAGVANEEER